MATKALADHTKEELIQMVCHLKDCKKFGLMWEEKPEKVAKDCQEKLPILKEVENKFIMLDQDQPTNIIIEGDNYHALSVLNYTHAGKIDVIYIDPPYNTGNQDFVYNDKIVDNEDCYRHSKWLSFMEKRLKLSKDLLAKNGIIFISIDDNEQARLKVLCDEIFGKENFIANLVWRKKYGGGKGSRFFVDMHEYVLCYAKNLAALSGFSLERTEDQTAIFKETDEFITERGKFYIRPLKSGLALRKTLIYDIECPDGSKVRTQWICAESTFKELLSEGRIVFKKLKNGKYNVYKKFYEKDKGGLVLPESILYDIAYNQNGKEELKAIFNINNGRDIPFNNPKPTRLIKYLLSFIPNNSELTILDFFAGSGTTGQAVLELNKSDGGKRQFILCTNNENRIAEDITYPRIKTVITGVRPDGSKYSDGIPANVRYFKTDFVSKNKTNDKLRREIAPLCTDMIRIRENCFESVIDTEKLKVVKNARGLTALIFDDGDLVPYITEIEKLDTEAPVFLYVFSYNNDNRDYEIPTNTRHKYKSQPIPEGVLSVYRRIFQPKGN